MSKQRKLSDRPQEYDPVTEDLAQVAVAVAEDRRTEVKEETVEEEPVSQEREEPSAPSEPAAPVVRNWIVNLESMWLPRDINIDASAGCKTPDDVRAILHQRLDAAIKAIKPTR